MTETEKVSQMGKQVKIIENRLDQATKKYSEIINKNKSLRDQIDQLRREKVVFDQAYGSLEKQLGVKRNEISKLVDSIAEVNQDRSRAVLRI